MKIVVLNGSPKGLTSVTMQYVHYISKEFKEHELKIINISQKLKKIEKDQETFQEILDEIKTSDGVLWASPVYYFLIPSNYKRFIELISEKSAESIFENKYSAFLSTSIHFFDHTAHNYMNGVCDDLNMNYTGSFSADMHDLLKSDERDRLKMFAENFFNTITKKLPLPKNYSPLTFRDFEYKPEDVKNKIDSGNKKIIIVTDNQESQSNLEKMTERFKSSFSTEIESVNLFDLDFKGSCLGCISCGYDNKCVYEGKDDFIEFYSDKIKNADILIWAGAIKDRYLSSRWKMFFDRSFYKGHTPSLMGKQVGFIISGPLNQNHNLRQTLEAYVEIQQANVAGFVTDDQGDSSDIDNLLQLLGENVVQYSAKGYVKPKTFLAIGGMKLFRDEIWGRLRFPFRADYVAYKDLDMFDFPQKQYKFRLLNGTMLLLSKMGKFRIEVNKRLKKEMIKPLVKVLKKID